MKRISALAWLLVLLLGPAACGLNGDLYLPEEEPAAEPADTATSQDAEDEKPGARPVD